MNADKIKRDAANFVANLGPGARVRVKVSKLVQELYVASLKAGIRTPADCEYAREAERLHCTFDQLSSYLYPLSDEGQRFMFGWIGDLITAAHACGQHDAPEGRSARSVHEDKADRKAVQLLMTVTAYLNAHSELAPKASEKFARLIQPDIAELLNSPISLSAIVEALRRIKKSSLILQS